MLSLKAGKHTAKFTTDHPSYVDILKLKHYIWILKMSLLHNKNLWNAHFWQLNNFMSISKFHFNWNLIKNTFPLNTSLLTTSVWYYTNDVLLESPFSRPSPRAVAAAPPTAPVSVSLSFVHTFQQTQVSASDQMLYWHPVLHLKSLPITYRTFCVLAGIIIILIITIILQHKLPHVDSFWNRLV